MKNIFALFHVNAVRKENEVLLKKNDDFCKENEALRKKCDKVLCQENEALREKNDDFRKEIEALREENKALRKSTNTIENILPIDKKSLLKEKPISSLYHSSGNSDQAMLSSPPRREW